MSYSYIGRCEEHHWEMALAIARASGRMAAFSRSLDTKEKTVFNHLLNGMILQVLPSYSFWIYIVRWWLIVVYYG